MLLYYIIWCYILNAITMTEHIYSLRSHHIMNYISEFMDYMCISISCFVCAFCFCFIFILGVSIFFGGGATPGNAQRLLVAVLRGPYEFSGIESKTAACKANLLYYFSGPHFHFLCALLKYLRLGKLSSQQQNNWKAVLPSEKRSFTSTNNCKSFPSSYWV